MNIEKEYMFRSKQFNNARYFKILQLTTDILVISVLFTKLWSNIYWIWRDLLAIYVLFNSIVLCGFSLLFLILARTEQNSAESECRIVWKWTARQLQEKSHLMISFSKQPINFGGELNFFEKLFFLLSTLTASLGWDRITVCRDKSNWDSETKE